MGSLFKVKALYDFEAAQEDDLGFAGGQIIDITEEVDDNWLEGKYTDAAGQQRAGIFPREFVEKYEPALPARPTRPARPKQHAAPAPTPQLPPRGPEVDELGAEEDNNAPALPMSSKPQAPAASRADESVSSPPSANISRASTSNLEPPSAPKPTPAEPATGASKKPPPPIAVKSNAFRDRIAAFNAPIAAPLAPMQPGGQKSQPGGFIKKPFVAPPPSSNAYVPPPKAEPVHKPYVREEDPEIRRRQEEDQAAAENAGLTAETTAEPVGEEDEDAPKPQSLKERIALLQKQQMEQAQRRADTGHRREKAPPVKQASQSSEHDPLPEGEEAEPDGTRSGQRAERKSLDVKRDKPRVSSSQRRTQETQPPLPSAPENEILSDGNDADHSAAGETTDDAGTIGPEDSDETQAPDPIPARASGAPKHEAEMGDQEDTAEDDEEPEEEDEVDEETRRRTELRERMAKMSGGMGMAGMFGPAGGMPLPGAASKRTSTIPRRGTDENEPSSPPQPQQRMPMIPIPGFQQVQSPPSDTTQTPGDRDIDDDEEQPPPPPRRSTTIESRGAAPPVPKDTRPPEQPSQERGAPPPVPGGQGRPPAPSARPVPPPPVAPLSPGPGSESDDEMSMKKRSSAEFSGVETPGPLPVRTASNMAPPVPGSRDLPPRPPPSTENKRASYFPSDPPPTTSDKRSSRVPPPVPGSPAMTARPPPPPPPGAAPPSRRSTDLRPIDDDNRGESEYEGDYDTDIASSAKHRDALKGHLREPSLDDSTTAEESSIKSPPQTSHASATPRAVPPPPPSQAGPKSRQSLDAPRAPPPMPPRDPAQLQADDDDYDPYRYDESSRPVPPRALGGVPSGVPPPVPPREPEREESDEDDLYSAPPRQSMETRAPPPPLHAAPPPDRALPGLPPSLPTPSRALPRQSLDVQHSSPPRRSADLPRASGDYSGQIAADLNLPRDSLWWTAPHPLPPTLQPRNGIDILSESEASTTAKRGGRSTISKDIYILYMDYSQTILTVRYDSQNPADVQFEQDHKPPPPKLRQDELETAWRRFGKSIAEAAGALASGKKDAAAVGEGTPAALVLSLLAPFPDALQPIGTRAYGALVYVNLANASTQQFDEIRPGDVLTLRNARFEGHHGAMRKGYKAEYGGDGGAHVAVVEEWDGTRRSVRCWEQGRGKGGVKSEKFRLGDLRSGEVRVWRVVGREWVGWGEE